MIYNTFVASVKEYFDKEFAEWERSTGQRQTYKAFAAWLGVSYTTLAGWRNQNFPPSGENLRKVSRKLGPEIFEIVGQQIPEDLRTEYSPTDDQLRPIAEMILLFSPEQRPAVRAAIEEMLAAALRGDADTNQAVSDILRRLKEIASTK